MSILKHKPDDILSKKWILATILVPMVILVIPGAIGCSSHSTSVTVEQTSYIVTSVDQASSTDTSANGLNLTLSMNSNTFKSGDTVSITIEEKNTLTTDNNVPVADLWPVQGLNDGPTGTVNYPFGISILQGYYDASNIASITPLILYDPNAPYAGPMELAGIISYDFQPSSDIADIYTKYDSEPLSMNMTAGIKVVGFWISGLNATSSNFTPGIYTVVGGNEWGALAILHFTVS